MLTHCREFTRDVPWDAWDDPWDVRWDFPRVPQASHVRFKSPTIKRCYASPVFTLSTVHGSLETSCGPRGTTHGMRGDVQDADETAIRLNVMVGREYALVAPGSCLHMTHVLYVSIVRVWLMGRVGCPRDVPYGLPTPNNQYSNFLVKVFRERFFDVSTPIATGTQCNGTLYYLYCISQFVRRFSLLRTHTAVHVAGSCTTPTSSLRAQDISAEKHQAAIL